MSARRSGRRSADGRALLLGLGGLIAAGVGQAVIVRQGWPAIGAFALAALLFALAARRAPLEPELAEAAPGPWPPRVLIPLFVGLGLCLLAGILVYQFASPRLTHTLWSLGLIAFAVGAVLGPAPPSRLAPLTPAQRAALAAIVALAVVVFGWALTSIPAEVHGDDAEVGLDAIRLLESFNLFASGWFELPRFHAFPTMLGLRVFGITLFGLRATSALLGGAGVLLLFAVVRRLWSADLALLAALLLVGQRFYIHLSRTGYHYIDTPVLTLLALWLLLHLWQENRLGAALWCGLALGLGIQTYYASRLAPLLLALTWFVWLPETPRGRRGARLLQLVVIAVTALAVAAPMFGYFAHHWADFWERTRDTSMFTPAARHHLSYGYGTENLGGILAIQLRAALSLFNLTGDNSVQYGYGGPLLDPISGALFVLGAALALSGLRQRRWRLVVLWTVLPLIAGAALTVDTPFYPRISGLVPFAVLLVAVALWQLRALLAAVLPRRAGGRLVATLLAAATALILAVNLRTYFVDYAPRYRHSPAVEIAGFVNRHGRGRTTYMVGGAPAFFIHHGTITFLTYGQDTRDIENLDSFLAHGRFDPRRSAFVIMPQGIGLIDTLEQAVGPLQVQTHRSKSGDVAFLTAVPRAAGDAPDPPELLNQAATLGPVGRILGRVLAAIERLALAVLAVGGVAALLYAALLAWHRPRPPGIGALREPFAERWARWRTRLAGPDPREPANAPSRAVTAALLVLVLAAALGLRVYRLTELPAGFFCDEAGNGFNTACLLYAGRDETGARLPLYVWSFGTSYKNPVFLYSAMLPMAALGPTEMAVRLTAALWGVATVLALFFLGRALMGSLVGLMAALLLAVCPWHLHFSRIGFELVTFPFFFTCAVTCLVRWTQGRRTLAQAAVLLGLCLYTYVPAKLFVPLFTAGFALIYWRALRARWRETVLAAALLVVTVAPVAIFDLVHRDQAGSYFEHTTLLGREGSPLAKARLFVENYGEFFSPEFLFRASNDRIIRHSVGEHGELYPFMAPLLVLGALAAVLRRDRALLLPLLWLALYPVAAALMNEIPSASRGFIGAAAFCLVAALGAGAVLRLANGTSSRRAVVWAVQGGLVAVLLVALVPAVRAYWYLYSEVYPRYSAKEYTGFQFGHRRVLEVFRERYDDFDLELLTTRRSNQPDIFLRFYDGLRQPRRPDQAPPFEHREKMVASSPEARDHYVVPGRRILFAVLPEEVPLFADPHVLERVIAPDGSAAFVLVAATRLKDFVSTWRVGGLFPEGDTSPPPTWAPEEAPDEDPPGIQWRLHDQLFAGVGLNDFFTPNAEHACAWAMNFVSTDVERDLRVFAGFDDTGEVWVNGSRAALRPVTDPDHTLVDAMTGRIHLNPGRNTIAVRACEDTGDWRFYFRLENLDGTPVEGLSWTYGPARLPE
ncbi:MAG TPA: glycosyltransferase family 39 protein [Candidatus Dormibacteraeota bacterium]|nr:glycosyltransferase family 39 protein [Candidatus Dormibacteraeota bacterium]